MICEECKKLAECLLGAEKAMEDATHNLHFLEHQIYLERCYSEEMETELRRIYCMPHDRKHPENTAS